MGFFKFLRPSHAGSSDRDKVGLHAPSASSDGLAPPTPSFYGPSSSTSRVPSNSSLHLTDVDRDPTLGRPDSPAGSFASSRKDRDKKQRLLGIGRREKELKSIPYSTFTPPSRSTASITKDEPTLLSPPNVPAKHEARQRSSSQLARPPTSPITIHQRTSSIPSAPPPPAPAPELGSLDFGSPLGNGQRFSAIFAEVLTGKTVAGQDAQDKLLPSATLAVPSFSPAPSAPNSRPISGISMDGIGHEPSSSHNTFENRNIVKEDVREVERLKVDEEKEKEKKSAFWKVRNRRNSKGGETEVEEKMEVVASAEPKSTLREPSDKPKLRRPSSSVWQFARNRTSSYNMTETIDASALDTNESAIDDGSFQLKSFRHVSSASMSLPAAMDQAASPTLEAPPPLRPDMHSRAPSATSSVTSFDDDRPPTRVSVAAFRKGIRAHSFVAVDKDNASTRPSVAGTAPSLGVGPDDDLPLSFLAGDTFKQKQQTKRPSLPNTHLAPSTKSISSTPASPTTPASQPPPSSFARGGASPMRSDEATKELGLSIQRPRSVTKPNEATKGFVVLSRTASRTDLTGSPSQPPASYTSPGQGSEEMLMPSSEEICTSPLEMEMPPTIPRMKPENGRRSPGPATNAPRRNSLQPNAWPIPVPSPNGATARPAETSSTSRPASFFDDPLRLISSFIGRDDEPRIPTPPPRSDDGVDDNEEHQQQPTEEVKKDGTLGLELAGLNLPLPPHAMPDDAPASPRSSLGRGPGPRPPLHARLASASGASAFGSTTTAPLTSPGGEPRPQSLLSPAQIKPAATRRDSHESDWRRPPVRPKASVSSMQSSGAKSRSNADAWADSSSDDEAPQKRKAQGPAPKVPTAIIPRPSLGNMRVSSSGTNSSAHLSQPSQVPKAVVKPSMAQRKKQAASSSSESEEDQSSSSSDEPLATVRQKASMSSLNVNVVSKAAAPPSLGNRRPSASASASREPSTFEHTPPGLPRHASSRSSLYQSSPAAMNTTLPSPPVLASSAPKRSPQTFAPALRGQPSPASSVSGKTGDSSSLGAPAPSTPTDSRRVSFLPNDAKGTLKARASAGVLGDAERDSKRNERRREEAKQAVELGNLVNGPKAHVPSAEPLAMDPMAQNGYNPYMNPVSPFDPRMAWAMQQAASGPQYAMMHQQAMAFAKQQYQQAMAAAAMQAANDEWERSSAMTGFSGTPSLPSMPSYGGYPTSPYGMPQLFPAMSNYAGSEYGGGGRASMYGSPGGGWGSQSVYGESFGPSPALPPMPSMPRSSTSHDVRSDMPTPRKERMSSYDNDGATPRRRHFSSSSVDLPKVLAGSQQSAERRHPGGARQARKAPLLQAHGGVPSAPSSWRRGLDEREELDDRQKERTRPRGAR